MSLKTGQTIGDYEVIDLLESSKAGVSYKVRNVLAQRYEMLKVLPRELQEDQERVERFLREIKVHARLAHPNIVSFYNATHVDGQLIMTTELVEGMTLAQRFESGPITLEDSVDYLCQVLTALENAHQHGVVHREITPSNIIVTPEGVVKLTGFGLAKAASDPQLTQMGTMVGALEYMSPEQVKGIPVLDARTDIYSTGVVLYELATGSLPFEWKSQFDMLLAHVNTPPKPPREINPDVPDDLEQVILTALAKNPEQRFQTAEAFRRALETVKPALKECTTAVQRSAERAPAPKKTDPLPTLVRSDHQKTTLGPASTLLPPQVVTEPARAVSWASREAIVAGVFMFIVVAVAFFAFLTITNR